VAVAGAGAAAALVVGGHDVWGGVAVLIGGAALSWAGVTLDADPDARSRLIGRVVDPLFDSTVLAGMAWASRQGSARTAVLAMVSLGASYVAAYERARAESLGYRASEGGGYRATRSALLVVGLLFGVAEAALWAFAVLTASAAAARAMNVANQERGAARPPPAGVRRTG
jgi:CDP-diacylglycerol--glycerol-3-phosphate 3-phosphatidyltransferase